MRVRYRTATLVFCCLTTASCRRSPPAPPATESGTSGTSTTSASSTPVVAASTSTNAGASATPPGFLHAAVTTEEKRCKSGNCFCAAPLGCGGDKPCVTFDENVSAFRTALKGVGSGKDRRTVTCNHAEVGTCGDYRYFFFDGDIYRTELRFFDKSGAFVGEIARTDYAEYCGGTASERVRGAIPKCTIARTELICGKASDVTGLITSLPL